jgi:hypothetical protein
MRIMSSILGHTTTAITADLYTHILEGMEHEAADRIGAAFTAARKRPRDDGSLDGVDFRRDVLPKLQGLPVRVIAAAMGASISHGSTVRGGKPVPHKRHWRALLALGVI